MLSYILVLKIVLPSTAKVRANRNLKHANLEAIENEAEMLVMQLSYAGVLHVW